MSWDENSNVFHKLYIAELQFSKPYFMEIFMIGAWILWKERNDFIFNHKPPSVVLGRHRSDLKF
jgi:hypothetical protein